MHRREEFLKKTTEAHLDYVRATAVIRVMMDSFQMEGPEWDSAVARQIAALDAWAALPRAYANFQSEVGETPH
jgi:hypothetical protein